MKTKLLTMLIVSASSFAAMAASPFMVNHSTVEAGGGRAEARGPQRNSTTLAESLVQLRHCDGTDHIGSNVTEQQTPAGSLTPTTPSSKSAPQ